MVAMANLFMRSVIFLEGWVRNAATVTNKDNDRLGLQRQTGNGGSLRSISGKSDQFAKIAQCPFHHLLARAEEVIEWPSLLAHSVTSRRRNIRSLSGV
jgi:hypothetical protein